MLKLEKNHICFKKWINIFKWPSLEQSLLFLQIIRLFVKVISFHYWFSFFAFLLNRSNIFKSLIAFSSFSFPPLLCLYAFTHLRKREKKLRFFFFSGSLHFPRICWHGNLYQKWISNSVNKVIVEITRGGKYIDMKERGKGEDECKINFCKF